MDLSYIHPSLVSCARELDELTPDPKNARLHSRRNLDAIKTSLQRHGARQLIVAQSVGGELIVRSGNGRLAAAKELGWTHFPVLVVEEDDDAATAYAIADNRAAELAEWDYSALADLGSSLDLSDVGFTDEEQEALLNITSDEPDTAELDDTLFGEAETCVVRVRVPEDVSDDVANAIEDVLDTGFGIHSMLVEIM